MSAASAYPSTARIGPVVKVGVEGTGSYGVGLARHLDANGVEVVEVDRPNRQKRRKLGSAPIVFTTNIVGGLFYESRGPRWAVS